MQLSRRTFIVAATALLGLGAGSTAIKLSTSGREGMVIDIVRHYIDPMIVTQGSVEAFAKEFVGKGEFGRFALITHMTGAYHSGSFRRMLPKKQRSKLEALDRRIVTLFVTGCDIEMDSKGEITGLDFIEIVTVPTCNPFARQLA